MPSGNGEPLALSLMPTELILMIAWNLPPSSRALFALTCKRFWYAMTRRVSCELGVLDVSGASGVSGASTRDQTELLGLGIPRELPFNFQDLLMSDPQLFQPERWELLRLLERDISDTWLLCFDCFKLHPRYAFLKSKTALVPWLKSCFGLLDLQSPPRSCRYLSRATPNQEAGFLSLSGIVDLCPCAHLTPAKRDRVHAELDIRTQNGLNLHYGHSCVQVYDDIELQISLTAILFRKDGELGFHITYNRKNHVDSRSVCPRMLCPHISLDTLISTFSHCREMHSENIVCARCKELQRCPECHTSVLRFVKDTESVSGMVSYIVMLERRLDKKIWNKHVVFPFARQRQYESMRTWSRWKLW